MIRRAAIAAMAACVLLAPGSALAQAYRCAIPADLPRPRPDGPDAQTPRRVVPIGGYTLALSWAPQYCRENARDRNDRFQCGAGNRFGFTLHGLWPDGRDRVWPQYCRAVPLLSEPVVRANLCATPSVQLLQHEWAKHGSCMDGGAAAYFGRATRLYARLRYPDMDALSRRRDLTVAQFATAVARANPGLRADMMRVTTAKGGWLDELWVCLDTRFRYRACPAHQRQPTGGRLRIWRSR
ncbi:MULTISPECIES: ribonuclease T2 [unclassified Sphingomonas]|uniref:ribonuclease T2 family protein n=1 Tax=unclassified Sphingomonas TaxID=196159 RepID=UPI000835C976